MEEDKIKYPTTMLKEKINFSDVWKEDIVTTMCILFSVDQQYLQNDIIMEKMIQTLFLIIMKTKQQKLKIQ
jgi:hypothetical protein